MLVAKREEDRDSREKLLQDARNFYKKTMNDTFPGWKLKLLTKPRKTSKSINQNISSEDSNNNNRFDLQKSDTHVSNNMFPSHP